jgi:hypothetical protein
MNQHEEAAIVRQALVVVCCLVGVMTFLAASFLRGLL